MTEEEHVVKKTITMEDLRILDVCREIELLAEQFYRCFADLFPEDKEITALWRKTANEEANHAQQFELAIRHKNEMLASVNIEPRTVVTAFKFIRTLLENAQENPPGLADALKLSVMQEERLAGLHLECIAGFAEESHKKLFKAMMSDDKRHLEALLEAQRKYLKVNPAKAQP